MINMNFYIVIYLVFMYTTLQRVLNFFVKQLK